MFAVDCADIIDHTKQVVIDNNYSNIIYLIKGKIEEIELPCLKVDIIISEWMGYCLFFESMLDTVIFARNKWLKRKNGLMFPDRCTLYLTAINDWGHQDQLSNYWDNVYGFDMSVMKLFSYKESRIKTIEPYKVS